MVYFSMTPPPEAPIDIVYTPEDPAVFVAAPGGQIPQRDTSAVWSGWLTQTLVLLALFVPVIAIVLDRQRRQRS